MKTKKNEDYTKYQQYALDVVEGKIVACKLVIKASERYLSWFDRDDIYFDTKACDKVVKFISFFHHWSGDFNGKQFLLLPFQKFLVYNIFGWKRKDTGERVIKRVYFQIARKNAKTMLASVIQAYMLFAEGIGDSQVYTIANSTSQASLAFNMAKTLLKQVDPNGKHFKYYRDMVKFPKTNSLMRVLSSDYSRLDGLNAYSAIIDEYHAATTNEVYSILRTSQASRSNSLLMVTTTAGFLLDGAAKQMRDMCVEILNGNITDDGQLAIIYELDEGDDYRDENVWIKANPSINHIVRKEFLEEQVREAQNNTALETSIITKNFDTWVATSQTWLPSDIIINAQGEIPEDFWNDKTVYCGLDLSSVEDLTALSMITYVEDVDKYYFSTKYYLPQETVKTSPNRELYQHWAKKNYLCLTLGNCVDYDYILNDLMKIYQQVDCVANIGYDKWNSTYLVTKATEQGLPMIPISQSIGNLNKPTKELTRLMMSGKVVFEHNPITRWCFANCGIKTDWNDNVKVVKGGSISGKIDGTIAMIMALSAYQGGNIGNQEIFSLTY